jgi:hypothetical protein
VGEGICYTIVYSLKSLHVSKRVCGVKVARLMALASLVCHNGVYSSTRKRIEVDSIGCLSLIRIRRDLYCKDKRDERSF